MAEVGKLKEAALDEVLVLVLPGVSYWVDVPVAV